MMPYLRDVSLNLTSRETGSSVLRVEIREEHSSECWRHSPVRDREGLSLASTLPTCPTF